MFLIIVLKTSVNKNKPAWFSVLKVVHKKSVANTYMTQFQYTRATSECRNIV